MIKHGKVYKDINEFIKATIEVPEGLWELEELMREAPNTNHTKEKKVYQRKEYIIVKIKNDYMIINTHKKFDEGHTRVKDFKKAKSLIDLCVRTKLPNKPRIWEIKKLINISNNKDYIKKLKELLEELK